jgi:hypothetical protein
MESLRNRETRNHRPEIIASVVTVPPVATGHPAAGSMADVRVFAVVYLCLPRTPENKSIGAEDRCSASELLAE